MCTQQVILDSTLRSSQTLDFEEALRAKIVSQEEALQAMVDLYQVFSAGLNPPGRPVGSLLFLGPTGCGKTRVVEAAAETLFGDSQAVIKVNCGEFQHSHEISKLIGSPPGYLGHRETHPMITQEALAASHTDKLKLSFLLFDEIEKANDALWQLLLGMLDKATLTLGDNRRVDLSQTVIFMTSNLGSTEITELMQGGMGFVQPKDKPATGLDEKVERTAVEAARRTFSPEFMNRLDKLVVFHALSSEQLEKVLQIELNQVQRRVLETDKRRFLFHVTDAGRQFILQEGTDRRYGARHLKRAIDRHVISPLANLLATETTNKQPAGADAVGGASQRRIYLWGTAIRLGPLLGFTIHSLRAMDHASRHTALPYKRLRGSISTSSPVCGISLVSQYAKAPFSSFVNTERLGDFSRNWNRCSFFSRASGAVAGPRTRTSFPSCGEKYSESCRDHRITFSKLVSRTITLANDVNGGYAIICRKCNSRSKNAL